MGIYGARGNANHSLFHASLGVIDPAFDLGRRNVIGPNGHA